MALAALVFGANASLHLRRSYGRLGNSVCAGASRSSSPGKHSGRFEPDGLTLAPNCDSVISSEKAGHMRKWVRRISYVFLTLLVLAPLGALHMNKSGEPG